MHRIPDPGNLHNGKDKKGVHELSKMYRCIGQDDRSMFYSVRTVPCDFNDQVTSGATTIALNDADVIKASGDDEVAIDPDEESTRINNDGGARSHSRNLSATIKRTGECDVLVVRVTFKNGDMVEEPSVTSKDIFDSVFGHL